VYQHALGGVADRGAGGLRIENDVRGHVNVRGLVHVYVADSGAGLNDGHGGIFNHGADEPLGASGNEHVDIGVHVHELVCAFVGGIGDELDAVGGQGSACKGFSHNISYGDAGVYGLFAAAKDAGVAGLEAQRRGVRCDVGAGFVDNGDNSDGYGGLHQMQPVGTHFV